MKPKLDRCLLLAKCWKQAIYNHDADNQKKSDTPVDTAHSSLFKLVVSIISYLTPIAVKREVFFLDGTAM